MPIDEDLITTMMQKLQEEGQNIEYRKSKINRVFQALGAIRQIKDRIQNETSGEIEEKILPIFDNGTGKPITTERRQVVYDASIAEAQKILNITPPTPSE